MFSSPQLEDLFEVKKRETECIKSETTNPSTLAKIYRSTFMLHEQDNGSMMGPLNVEHFRFDDADIAMVIPQQPASLQRGKAWKTHYRRHIAFFLLLGCLRTPLFPRPPFHQVCSLVINRDYHKLFFSATSDLALLWGYY